MSTLNGRRDYAALISDNDGLILSIQTHPERDYFFRDLGEMALRRALDIWKSCGSPVGLVAMQGDAVKP